MSDREDASPSGSYRSEGAANGSGSLHEEGSIRQSASRSRSRSRERERDRSPSPRHASKKYSRSRSRSRSYSRKRYRSRSRSYSPYMRERERRPQRKSRYSRSRSRSYSPRNRSPKRSRYGGSRGYHRSHSRSPMSNRRRHAGNREDPKHSRCVGVFGLSLYTQERDIRDHFERYGPIDDIQVVYDRQTGRSRGFAFVYYRNTDDAIDAKEAAAGSEIDGRRIRCDFSITERAHTPTPGIYLGKPTSTGYSRRRSPSPYYSRRSSRYSYSRSRSRSYSPRRY